MTTMPRLTEMSHGAGCGCKIGPGQLDAVLRSLPQIPGDVNILVDAATADDAAVVRVREDLAIVATLDFFTPIVDDPATFGAIAATNAISDLYAMGATPLLALGVCAFPREGDMSVLGAIMRGGAEVALANGCPVLGGHTIDDAEPKYGLVAIGTVDPRRMLTNADARPGDLLVLTKALGVGAISSGVKKGVATADSLDAAVASMLTTNAAASRAAIAAGATCATDVTGFGLLGHLRELCLASGVGAEIRVGSVPELPGARDLIAAGYVPGGTGRNREFAGEVVDFAADVDEIDRQLLFDPQTSGGLLIAVTPERRDALSRALVAEGHGIDAEIGEVVAEPPGRIFVGR